MTPEKLAVVIRLHGIPAFVYAGAVFAVPHDTYPDGRTDRPVEHVHGDYPAVLVWLGY